MFVKVKKTAVAAGLLCCFAVSACDCASKAEVSALRADLAQTKRTADEALASAKHAEQTAADANSRAQTTEEVVNRSFKKTMYK